MRIFTAAVVGLGRIGQEYDYSRRGSSRVLTHATAFASHRGYQLIAGVDPARSRRSRFERKFRRPAFPSVEAMLSRHSPEVVALGVPTGQHYAVFQQLLAGRPRAVICEKPIAATTTEARAMTTLARSKRCALLVNYMRRFEPGVLALRRAMQRGRFGSFYKGVAWYSKGLLHNGSHLIDLLRFLLGEAGAFAVTRQGRVRREGDAEPDVWIDFDGCRVHFLAAREERFSVAEFELLGTAGRIRYCRGGELIQTWRTEPDPAFAGHRALQRLPQSVRNDFNRYQWHVAAHLHSHLTRGVPLHSDGTTATTTLNLVERILSRK
jgi:predicted dehydrogenase